MMSKHYPKGGTAYTDYASVHYTRITHDGFLIAREAPLLCEISESLL